MRLQYRLSTLIAILTLVAICGGWWQDHSRLRKAIDARDETVRQREDTIDRLTIVVRMMKEELESTGLTVVIQDFK